MSKSWLSLVLILVTLAACEAGIRVESHPSEPVGSHVEVVGPELVKARVYQVVVDGVNRPALVRTEFDDGTVCFTTGSSAGGVSCVVTLRGTEPR